MAARITGGEDTRLTTVLVELPLLPDAVTAVGAGEGIAGGEDDGGNGCGRGVGCCGEGDC